MDPDVLINNKTYPIDVQALEDRDIAIKLDKFQTKVTPIMPYSDFVRRGARPRCYPHWLGLGDSRCV